MRLAVTNDTASPDLSAAAASGSEGGTYFCFSKLPSSFGTNLTSRGPGLKTLTCLGYLYFFYLLGLFIGVSNEFLSYVNS